MTNNGGLTLYAAHIAGHHARIIDVTERGDADHVYRGRGIGCRSDEYPRAAGVVGQRGVLLVVLFGCLRRVVD